MKRTKMKRRKSPKSDPQDPYAPSPIGGHLPDPPDDCSAKEFWVNREGRYFIDLSICLRHCGNRLCERYKIYMKAQKQRRQAHFESKKQAKEEK